jgi:2-polyprenyl-3-methyl-5-hydroxy-6-metoxy-1,4-benzoquinol methylase
MPLYKFVGNKILTAFQNRMLGLRLSEFHSGYRVYRCAALKELPYHRCSNDFHFDTEIIIQLHAKGFRIAERPIPTYYGSEICYVNGMRYAWDVVRSTLGYWLHERGLVFIETFNVSPARYPLKLGRWSSHQHLARLVRPGTRVLDVGCGEGLLARLVQARGAEVVGVDQRVGPQAQAVCQRTYEVDLERGLPLGEERPFETILLADVLEHVKAYDQLLEECRRWLAPGGRLIVSTGNVAHLWIRLGLLFGHFDYTPRGILDRTHVVLFTLRSLRRLLADHQFRVLAVAVTPIPFEAIWPRWASRWWVRGLTACAYALAKLWKTLFAYQFIVVAESARRVPIEPDRWPGAAAQGAPDDQPLAVAS